MFFISFLRVIKFSLQDISRNIWLSLVTIIILVLTLFSFNMLIVVKVIGDATVKAVKDRIDFSVYLRADADEKDVMALKARLENLSDIKEVKYISKNEAVEIFQKSFKNDPGTLQILRDLGMNPLSSSLIIKPKDIDKADSIINQINKTDSQLIDSMRLVDYKKMLSKINFATDKAQKGGLFLSLVFVFVNLLVIFNAVRVVVYTHHAEISIMRLVGASNSFVYMPFILSGLAFTLLGVVIIISLFFPFLSLLQPYLETFFRDYNVNMMEYFTNNFWEIFGAQFLGLAIINILASARAVRKYANV